MAPQRATVPAGTRPGEAGRVDHDGVERHVVPVIQLTRAPSEPAA